MTDFKFNEGDTVRILSAEGGKTIIITQIDSIDHDAGTVTYTDFVLREHTVPFEQVTEL